MCALGTKAASNSQIAGYSQKVLYWETSIHYLGLLIDKIGIGVHLANVQALVNWLIPSLLLLEKLFIGGLNFYQHFTTLYLKLVLHLLDSQYPFEIETNASHYATSAI